MNVVSILLKKFSIMKRRVLQRFAQDKKTSWNYPVINFNLEMAMNV